MDAPADIEESLENAFAISGMLPPPEELIRKSEPPKEVFEPSPVKRAIEDIGF